MNLDMDTETGLLAHRVENDAEMRRRGEDRRVANDRRRGQRRGLFELRALREGLFIDRRRGERRDEPRSGSWWGSWRRASR